MKKIRFFLIILSFLSMSMPVMGQSRDELYQKVFGKKEETKKILIDLTLGEMFLGQISVSVSGDQLKTVSGKDLNKIITKIVREEKIPFYTLLKDELLLSELPFKLDYKRLDLRANLILPAQDLRPQDANVFAEILPYYSKKSEASALFSFGTNYKIEKTSISKLDETNSLNIETDSFMNFSDFTLTHQMSYLSKSDRVWNRENSKLSYGRPIAMQMLEVGDVTHPFIGHQQSQNLGGISFFKDFSLNPYFETKTSTIFEYSIESRSLVKTYINNVLLKTEFMNPGHYLVKDIPLSNGLNRIRIEAIDDFQRKKVFIFNESGSVDTLAKGVNSYSLAVGFPSTFSDFGKKYERKDGPFFSGFYQEGVFKHWTTGGYLEGNKKYFLVGESNNLTSPLGNWFFDIGHSQNKLQRGEVLTSAYQFVAQQQSLNFKLEYRTKFFNERGELLSNSFDYSSNLSYGFPLSLSSFFPSTLSFGGNYKNPRSGFYSQYGLDSSLTSNLSKTSALTFYFSRSKDADKNWSTQLYCFLNFTIGDSLFGSAFYEKESETKRLTVISDNGNKIESLKISGGVDDNKSTQDGNIDLQYNTQFADFGIKEELIHPKNQDTGSRTTFKFLSAFSFVTNGKDYGLSISRPIANSFVIFKPNSTWVGQSFGVRSLSNDNESKTGLFGESLVSGLIPYQYRRVQLDPSSLDPGYTLAQESFVVYPKLRSGHLFVIGKSGLIVLRGKLTDKAQRPLALKVGFFTSLNGKTIPFFTGREGEILIEGIEPSLGKIEIDDEHFDSLEINLKNAKIGMFDIGVIELPFKN